MLVNVRLCSTIDLTVLWSAILFCTLQNLCLSNSWASPIQGDLQPHSVKVDAKSHDSLTLSWSPPNVAKEGPELIGYSVCYTSGIGSKEQRAVIGVEKRSVMITKLQPSTNYTVYVVAHYSDNQNASSPLFIVSTLSIAPAFHQECDCDPSGMSSCTPASEGGTAKCVCHPGYENNHCGDCAPTFFREGEKCKPCNCSTATSTGTCTPNIEEPSGRECSCHPEHLGPNCDTCSSGFYWNEDQCLTCECLTLCPKNHGFDICNQCKLTLEHSLAAIKVCDEYYSHHRRKPNRGDGTVAVVAVVVSLAFIAVVAAGVSYYRYKCQKQSKHALWSMELHEEKVSLNSACDYQRLDAAAINAKQDSSAKRQRPRAQSHANKAEGNHKYHCISI